MRATTMLIRLVSSSRWNYRWGQGRRKDNSGSFVRRITYWVRQFFYKLLGLSLGTNSGKALVLSRDKIFDQLGMFKHLCIRVGFQHRDPVINFSTKAFEKLPKFLAFEGDHQRGKPRQLNKSGCILGYRQAFFMEVLKFLIFLLLNISRDEVIKERIHENFPSGRGRQNFFLKSPPVFSFPV